MVSANRIIAKIDGLEVAVSPGTTILEAAEKVHIKVPTLCKHPDLEATAACGICIVKNGNSPKMLRACCTPLEEGMDIRTQDAEIVAVRRTVVKLILSQHPNECLTCSRNFDCELQKIAADFGIRREPYTLLVPNLPLDDSTHTIVIDPRKCIRCGRCIEVCQNIQDVWALSFLDRGSHTRISPAGEIALSESPCVRCGQCSAHCPTGAISEFDETRRVWKNIEDSEKHCVVQIAPAVRVAIGEAFGFAPGTNLSGKLYTTLLRMGFDQVFDTNFGADLTILEESHEFVSRFVEKKGALPLITSCCPAWIDYLEKYYGDLIEHFSSAKSPHEMVGVLSKTYYAQRSNIDPAKIFGVSIMPCTAKKYEIQRTKEMFASGYQDVDCALTTRELIRMIKQSGIDFTNLDASQPDHLLGEYTGAATIFGATGGVMEAAFRTTYFLVTGQELPDDALDFKAVRGLQGVKEAEVDLDGVAIRLAVAHGLHNVAEILDRVRKAKESNLDPPYHFIEVMACPGGCVGGGGQPYGVTDRLRIARAEGLYAEDRSKSRRRSHDNPYVQQLYNEFLGKPNGEKAHQFLHTRYVSKSLYQR